MTAARHAHVEAMEGYVEDVLSGDEPACEWIILACKRHRADLVRARSKAWPYRFDAAKAEKACKFAELLPHVKGRWAKGAVPERLRLGAWQCFFVGSLFGWVRKSTGHRRFRKARLYIPRKNGKSTLAAAIGLYMFTADKEPGPEVYSGATSEKQAWEVFGPARQMALKSQDLLDQFGVDVNAKSLVCLQDMGKFEPLIGNPGDGASPHCSITDEFHEHATDAQLATMETGMGAREQPLSLVISTAGDNLAGPCRDDWLQCQRMLQCIVDDEELFALIYTVDKDDDWTSEAALRKANPNYDVSVRGDFLLAQQRDAINNTRKQGTFKTKHLNLWVQARDAFINMQRWQECFRPGLSLQQFEKQRCFLALDLASKVDLASMVLLFPQDEGRYALFGKNYLPEETVEQKENAHYRDWRDKGWLTVTPGNIIDFAQIEEDVLQACSDYEVVVLAYDPHQATMLVTRLDSQGVPCIEIRPTVLNFSEPMKQIEALVRDRKLEQDGNPVTEFAMSNVVARTDAKDNVYPRKERAENKIDPFVAACMAMACAMQEQEQDISSFLKAPVTGR